MLQGLLTAAFIFLSVKSFCGSPLSGDLLSGDDFRSCASLLTVQVRGKIPLPNDPFRTAFREYYGRDPFHEEEEEETTEEKMARAKQIIENQDFSLEFEAIWRRHAEATSLQTLPMNPKYQTKGVRASYEPLLSSYTYQISETIEDPDIVLVVFPGAGNLEKSHGNGGLMVSKLLGSQSKKAANDLKGFLREKLIIPDARGGKWNLPLQIHTETFDPPWSGNFVGNPDKSELYSSMENTVRTYIGYLRELKKRYPKALLIPFGISVGTAIISEIAHTLTRRKNEDLFDPDLLNAMILMAPVLPNKKAKYKEGLEGFLEKVRSGKCHLNEHAFRWFNNRMEEAQFSKLQAPFAKFFPMFVFRGTKDPQTPLEVMQWFDVNKTSFAPIVQYQGLGHNPFTDPDINKRDEIGQLINNPVADTYQFLINLHALVKANKDAQQRAK